MQAMKIGPVADSFPTAWLTCAAAIDGGLTATLIYALLKERQYYKHTRKLLNEIAGLTLETGGSSSRCIFVRGTNLSAGFSLIDSYYRRHSVCSLAYVKDTYQRILVLH